LKGQKVTTERNKDALPGGGRSIKNIISQVKFYVRNKSKPVNRDRIQKEIEDSNKKFSIAE